MGAPRDPLVVPAHYRASTSSGPPSSRLSTSSHRRCAARQRARAQAAWCEARSGSQADGLRVEAHRLVPAARPRRLEGVPRGLGPGRAAAPPPPGRRGTPRRSRAAAPAPGTPAAPRRVSRSPSGTTSSACLPARGAPFTHWKPARTGPCDHHLAADRGDPRHRQRRSFEVDGRATSAERRRAGVTRATTPLPRPSPSADVQAVAGSRSSTAAPSGAPAVVSRRICGGGHRARLVVRRSKAVEDARSPPTSVSSERAAHPAQEVAEAAGARHAAREARREHPGGRGIEVDLVAEAQGVARDALVPGLARDHLAARLERDAAGELQARVGAARAGRPQRGEGAVEGGHLPDALGVSGVAPASRPAPARRSPTARGAPGRRRPRPAGATPTGPRDRRRPGRERARSGRRGSAARPGRCAARARRRRPSAAAQPSERQRATRAGSQRRRRRGGPPRAGRRGPPAGRARSFPSTTSGTCRPARPRSAWPRSMSPCPHSQRGRRAVTALDAVTTFAPDAPIARATTSGAAPRARPEAKARAEESRGRRPASARPSAIPAKAGIASDEFQTARPQTRPRAPTARAPERPRGGAAPSRGSAARAATSGKPVTSGIRKFGGGPVAVMSAMYGVPHAASSAPAQPGGRAAQSAGQQEDEADEQRGAQRAGRGGRPRGGGSTASRGASR